MSVESHVTRHCVCGRLGVFEYMKEKFSHSPMVDMTGELLALFSDLMRVRKTRKFLQPFPNALPDFHCLVYLLSIKRKFDFKYSHSKTVCQQPPPINLPSTV